jgi:AcrR family transcriptional regulator
MKNRDIGLRERTRRAVRGELVLVAVDLFLAQGYEATTVDQIAEAAGLSRRSFFRYFASKDDVLTQTFAAAGSEMAAELQARPTDEPPWVALRAAFEPLVVSMKGDDRSLRMTRLMLQSPALRASHLQMQVAWHDAVAQVLVDRLPASLPADERLLQAEALTGAALACLTTAQSHWVARDGTQPLGTLLDQAMSAVGVQTAQPA